MQKLDLEARTKQCPRISSRLWFQIYHSRKGVCSPPGAAYEPRASIRDGSSEKEVGIGDRQLTSLIRAQRAHKRVIVYKVEDAAGLQEMRNNLSPAPQIAQPGQHAVGAEDDLKLAAQYLWKVINIRADKGRRNVQLRAERQSQINGAIREIDAGDGGAFARPGERIEAKVALQVQQRAACYIGQLGALDRA